MGFNFNFLKTAGKDIEQAGQKAFHFLGNAASDVASGIVPGVAQSRLVQSKVRNVQQEIESNPQIKRAILSDPKTAILYNKITKAATDENVYNPALTIRDAAVSAGRGIARAPETIARSTVQAGFDLAHKINPNVQLPEQSGGAVTDPLREAIYGKEPIQTYQKRAAGNKEVVEKSRFKKYAAPLSFLGAAVSAGGDITFGGNAEKTVAEAGIEKLLAKETTEAGVRKILKDKVAPEILDTVTPAVAKATDANAVRNILLRATNPRDVIEGAAPVVQDITSATLPKIAATETDPFEEILGAVNGSPARKGQAGVQGLRSKAEEQAALLSKERGQRFGASAEAAKTALGTEGYIAEKKALAGQYSKVDFEPLVKDIGPDRAEELFTGARAKILSTPDSVYEDLGLHPGGARLNTQTAVRKVLGLEPGLPTKSELKLLSVYSPQLADEAKAALPLHRKIFDAAATLFGTARSAKSTADLSMGGRQGIFVAARHPLLWADANKESVKFATDSKYYQQEMKAIHSDGWGKLIDKFNPSILTGGGAHEEQYAAADLLTGKVAKKVGVGHVVAGAERAYTGGLTKLRKDIITKTLSAYGSTPEEVEQRLGKKGIEGVLEAVSTLTGRGGKKGGWVEKHATTLQEALFSPRLWASRLQPLNPAYWQRIGPAGRKEALQNYGSFAAAAGVVLEAAHLAGADVETDPRSSDFLKIKVGDTRYDILGGFQQNLVFLARQLSGETKSSVSGRITKYGDKYGGPTRLSAAADLVRNKANPVLGTAANLLEGKDKAGNKINPVTEIGQLFVPINIQQAWNSRANPKDVLKGLPDLIGIGSQTYGKKDIKLSNKQQAYIDKLKSGGKSKEEIAANEDFLQTLRVGPDRTKASSDINAALDAGDIAKAKQIADDYNKELSGALDEWRKKYGKYKTPILIKKYNSTLINLDNANIKARLNR